jgi:hypothetical protein
MKVLGFVVSESKSGSVGTNVYLQSDHDNYRKENAIKCEGYTCTEEYLRGDWSSKLQLGQSVNIIYGKGFQGKAVATDIVSISNK